MEGGGCNAYCTVLHLILDGELPTQCLGLADTNGVTVTVIVIAIIWNWAATESSIHQAAPCEAIGYLLLGSQGSVNKIILLPLEIISTPNPCFLQGGTTKDHPWGWRRETDSSHPCVGHPPHSPQTHTITRSWSHPYREGNRPELILWMQEIKTLYNEIVLNPPWAIEMTFFFFFLCF